MRPGFEVRGYSKINKRWIYGTGWWFDEASNFFIKLANGGSVAVEEKSISRWTGCYDSKQRKIFEDDYLIIEWYGSYEGPLRVVYIPPRFTLVATSGNEVRANMWSWPLDKTWLIIGNMTDTPMLDDYTTRLRPYKDYQKFIGGDKENKEGDEEDDVGNDLH